MAEIYLMPIGSEDAAEYMNNTLLAVRQTKIAPLEVTVSDGVYSGSSTNVWDKEDTAERLRKVNKVKFLLHT
ncbi:MAG: hypothetical protein QXK65_00545 [Candidatus Micrarchaeaceae archaeon]